MTHPGLNVDILILDGTKVLLGLLSKEWLYEGKQVYGVPGREILFQETITDTVSRNIREEFDCDCGDIQIISVNTNRAFGNHYIGIGAVTSFKGTPKLTPSKDWDTWEWHDLEKLPTNLFLAATNAIECFKKNKFCIAP